MLRATVLWSAFAAALNFGWEIAQLPLYTLYHEADRGVIAYSVAFNVSVRRSWTYAQAMPTVFGIGVSPLAQWLVVPTRVFLLTRLTLQRWETSDSIP